MIDSCFARSFWLPWKARIDYGYLSRPIAIVQVGAVIAWTKKLGTDMSEIKALCEGNNIKAWFWVE